MALSTTQRTFNKDLLQLHKSIETSTDGQAEIVSTDDMSIRIALKPKTGYNAHAVFHMTIQYTSSYPKTSPKITFNSPIFHPNIDPKMGHICLSLLNEWNSCWSLLDIVKAILYLIENPNFHSPNNGYCYVEDISELEVKTRRLLAGLEVNGYVFAPNQAWCEWAHENNCFPMDKEEEEKEEDKPKESTSNHSKIGKFKITELKSSCSQNQDSDSDALSVLSSETAPSFAKIRYSLNSEPASNERYTQLYCDVEPASQRVIIWTPKSDKGENETNIFYFIETLCDIHHYEELGNQFTSLYAGIKLPEVQDHSNNTQISSTCAWYPVKFFEDNNSCLPYGSYHSSVDIGEFFKMHEPLVIPGLTGDFCPWALADGLGYCNILGGLFANKVKRDSCTETLFNDGDNVFEAIFDIEESEETEAIFLGDTATNLESCYSEIEDIDYEQEEEEEEEEERERDEERQEEDEQYEKYDYHSMSTESGEIRIAENKSHYLMHECTYCNGHDRYAPEAYNPALKPMFAWILWRTRWSIRFAPQQTVDLSMEDKKIPPWRVSTARLLSDLCQQCKLHSETDIFILLDPMALSPMSPALNLMQIDKASRRQLTGILWMTPINAMSPFFRIPLPSDSSENVIYPSSFSLRFLTIGSLLTNWVSWFSRIETYSSFGYTRFRPVFLGFSVAARILQPLSLGCGQASTFDIWPLWLVRTLLKYSLYISKTSRFTSLLNGKSNFCDFNFFFPFSDIDEI